MKRPEIQRILENATEYMQKEKPTKEGLQHILRPIIDRLKITKEGIKEANDIMDFFNKNIYSGK